MSVSTLFSQERYHLKQEQWIQYFAPVISHLQDACLETDATPSTGGTRMMATLADPSRVQGTLEELLDVLQKDSTSPLNSFQHQGSQADSHQFTTAAISIILQRWLSSSDIHNLSHRPGFSYHIASIRAGLYSILLLCAELAYLRDAKAKEGITCKEYVKEAKKAIHEELVEAAGLIMQVEELALDI